MTSAFERFGSNRSLLTSGRSITLLGYGEVLISGIAYIECAGRGEEESLFVSCIGMGHVSSMRNSTSLLPNLDEDYETTNFHPQTTLQFVNGVS